jgi:RNA polymerase sigma factor (sigma-70 family)
MPEPDYQEAERQGRQYVARLHSYVRSVWGEDLVQEARISAWLAAERYRPGQNAQPATWQHRVVFGRVRNAHRALASSSRREWNARTEGERSIPCPLLEDDWVGPDPELDRVEWSATLGPLLARLPFEQSFVLRGRFWDGLSQAQVAQRLGCHQTQVSRLELRALTKLRAWLAA